MRPFAEMVMEFIGLAHPGIIGVATDKWPKINELEHHGQTPKYRTQKEILELCDNLINLFDRLYSNSATTLPGS